MNLNQVAASISITFSLCAFILAASQSAQAEPLKAAATFENTLASLPASASSQSPSLMDEVKDEYHVTTPEGVFHISVRKTWESGDSSLYVNNQEVIRFRSTWEEISPYGRARMTAYNLSRFLSEGGHPRDIRPGLENGLSVLRGNDRVLAVVDEETATLAGQSDKQLTLTWINQLRKALGADAIQREIAMQPSRGMAGFSREGEAYRSTGHIRTGLASWYGPGFHGRRSANGSRFNMNDLTAAHRTLPFGTRVRVSNPRTGRSCIVKITDRGPFAHNRVIDLSKGAAAAIGMLGSGIAKVTLDVLAPMTGP